MKEPSSMISVLAAAAEAKRHVDVDDVEDYDQELILVSDSDSDEIVCVSEQKGTRGAHSECSFQKHTRGNPPDKAGHCVSANEVMTSTGHRKLIWNQEPRIAKTHGRPLKAMKGHSTRQVRRSLGTQTPIQKSGVASGFRSTTSMKKKTMEKEKTSTPTASSVPEGIRLQKKRMENSQAVHAIGSSSTEPNLELSSEPTSPRMRVRVRDHIDGVEKYEFRIRWNCRLGILFAKYHEKMNLQPKTIRFLYDGRRLEENDTPAAVELEDGDVIDALIRATGGGH